MTSRGAGVRLELLTKRYISEASSPTRRPWQRGVARQHDARPWDVYTMNGVAWLDAVAADLRYACRDSRSARASPGRHRDRRPRHRRNHRHLQRRPRSAAQAAAVCRRRTDLQRGDRDSRTARADPQPAGIDTDLPGVANNRFGVLRHVGAARLGDQPHGRWRTRTPRWRPGLGKLLLVPRRDHPRGRDSAPKKSRPATIAWSSSATRCGVVGTAPTRRSSAVPS